MKTEKEINEELETFFNTQKDRWNKEINPLFDQIKLEMNLSNAPKIMEAQSLALSYRQRISEEIYMFLNQRSKQDVRVKKARADKFLFYSTGATGSGDFRMKSLSEKTILIDNEVSESDRNMQIIENYIEFLRATGKMLESLGYTIKNIIELYNYLSK